MKIGDYAFVKNYYSDLGLGKIRDIHSNGFYEKQVVIVFKNSTHSVEISRVVSSDNINELRKLYKKEYGDEPIYE